MGQTVEITQLSHMERLQAGPQDNEENFCLYESLLLRITNLLTKELLKNAIKITKPDKNVQRF